MSTILDALRKLQRERAPQDLRESVLGEDPLPEPRGSGGGLRLIILLLLLAGTAAGTSYLVWPRLEALRAQLLAPAGETEETAPTRVIARAPRANPTLPAGETAGRPERPTVSPTAEARRRAAREALAKRRGSADPQPGPTTSGLRPPPQRLRAQPSTPPPTPAAEEEAPAPTPVAEPPPAPAPPTRTARAPRAPPDRGLRTVDEFVQQPEIEKPAERVEPLDTSLGLEPAARRPEATTEPARVIEASDQSVEFPSLAVEAVRWHPDPERRVAQLLLDDTRPIEAHEGDIVAGLAIEKIEPGAIEVRMGELVRRIQIGQ